MSDRTSMRQLALDFFSAWGATIEPTMGDELGVSLPPALAAHFGKETLHLTFSVAEMAPFEDLVAPGSRVLDRMLSWMRHHGQVAALRLPARQAGPADPTALPVGLTRHNVTAHVHSARRPLVCIVFNLLLTCTADQRREEICTLILSADVQSHPELVDGLTDALEWVGADLPLSSEEVIRLAEQADELARQRAQEQAQRIEAEQQPALQQALAQLEAYYRSFIEALPADEAGLAQRKLLESELDLKAQDERLRHQVYAHITPLNWATLVAPEWIYNIKLQRPNGLTHSLIIAQNLYSGTQSQVLCHACGRPMLALGLCDNEHLACADCLHTCAVCGRDLCLTCGVTQEHIAGEWVCPGCAVTCAACGRPTLPQHTAPCAHCGQVFCDTCLETCPHCGRRFCPTHTITCTVCGAHRCVEQGLTCHVGAHAVCEAHHQLCPICGRDHCPIHSAVCTRCAQTVGRECIGENGRCHTCRTAAASQPITWPELAQRSGWEKNYAWRVAENSMWRVYEGERKWGPFTLRAIMVTDLDGQIRHIERRSPGDELIGRLSEPRVGAAARRQKEKNDA